MLKDIDSNYSFSVLAANVVTDEGESYFGKSYITKDVELVDGTTLKIGVFGVIDEDFYTSTASKNVEGITFLNAVETANEIAKQLKESEGCDLVIALTHNQDPESFAKETSNIDAVVAGHEHTGKTGSVTNTDNKTVPVVEAYYYLGAAGVLDLTVEYTKGSDGAAENVSLQSYKESFLTASDATGKSDSTVASLVSKIEAANEETLSVEIGTSSQDYPFTWETIRLSDQPLGHVVTAAYLDATGADIAIENAGGIRGGISEGSVTAGDVLSISPYGNTLSTYTLTGAQVLSMLETSLQISYECNEVYNKQLDAYAKGEDYTQYSWPSDSGSVLVVGGITLTIDWDQAEGSRVVSAVVNGEELVSTETYTVAMNNYIADKTDVYPELENKTLLTEWGTCEQVLREFFDDENWESQVYTLSGTVTYASDEDADEGEDTKTEDVVTDDTLNTGSSADTGNDSGKDSDKTNLPQTDDPLAGTVVLLVVCAAAGATVSARAAYKRAA